MITIERLKELVRYEPTSGKFVNLVRRGCNGVGAICGTIDGHDYVSIMLDRKYYAGHKLAWFYITGKWPEIGIDHENRIRHDNTWTNLRVATKSENGQNQNLSLANKSGYTGVSWCKTMNKWQAQIGLNKKQRLIGFYDCPKVASEAYKQAKLELHKFNPIVS